MAWRIDEELVRGEIDNRVPGRVTGCLWLLGREEPLRLELIGDARRDVAGHLVRFTNPAPRAKGEARGGGLADCQRGVVGEITASRRVRERGRSPAEAGGAGEGVVGRWGNGLHLEWYGERDGRVVVESVRYRIEMEGEAAWAMSAEEELRRRAANGRALVELWRRLGREAPPPARAEEPEEEAPSSAAEARADELQARLDLLLDRVQGRIERALAAGEQPDHEKILKEERERLRRERGEARSEPPTAEEEAERAAWVEEMYAIAEEAAKEAGDEQRGAAGENFEEERWHPLVERCQELTQRMRGELRERGWLGEEAGLEHPLREVVDGVLIAGGKLAGALGTTRDAEEWPPDPLLAGPALSRLKKARGHLRDALAGLGVADEQGLGTPEWRAGVRAELLAILDELAGLIAQVRAVLRLAEEGGEG
jgi:hypothetical protein